MTMTGSTQSANLSSFTELSDPVLASLTRIETDIRAGEHRAAATRLNDLQREAPTDPRVFLTGVMLADAVGNAAGALQAAERAVAVAPRWAPALIALARVLARQGEFERALAEADKAVAAAPRALQILEPATSIANMAGDKDRAAAYLELSQRAAPDNTSVRLSRGYNLLARRQFVDASRIFAAVLETEPVNLLALTGLARTALDRGDMKAAKAQFDELLLMHPDNSYYQYCADVADGKTPLKQPPEIAQSLFDGYATRFDKHLVGALKYRVPKRIAEIVRQHRPNLDFAMLDLGCGTGLMGVYVGKPHGGLVGVDVSGGMINEAIKHNIYDRFHQVNLLDALQASPTGSFDVITAADVFIYVGELSDAIVNAKRMLRPGGLFVFSCEATTADEPDLVLRPTERYAHSEASMRNLCQVAGFGAVDIEPFDIREEDGQAINGFIVVATT